MVPSGHGGIDWIQFLREPPDDSSATGPVAAASEAPAVALEAALPLAVGIVLDLATVVEAAVTLQMALALGVALALDPTTLLHDRGSTC